MKKYLIMLVMMFTMSIGMYAESNETNEVESFEKYDFNVNQRRLAVFLDLSEDQMESVEQITDELIRDMRFAFYENGNDSRKKVVSNVVKKNVKHMSYVLNKEQYQKYLKIFNVTLLNRGFEVNW